MRRFTKLIAGLLALVVISTGLLSLLTFDQIKQGRGGYVGVIDPSPYVDKFKSLGLRNVQMLSPDGTRFRRKNARYAKRGSARGFCGLGAG